jgi:plasmid stability protein
MAANFVVGNVEEDIALALKQLAAAHGRSAEAEHHEILRNVLKRPPRAFSCRSAVEHAKRR